MSTRWLAFGLGLSLCVLLGARTYPVNQFGGGVQLVGVLGVDDTTINASRCARAYTGSSTDLVCTTIVTELIVPRSVTITEVHVATNPTDLWGDAGETTEACDVGLLTGTPGSGGATPAGWTSDFQLGSTTVGRTVPTTDSRSGLSISVTAGQAIQISHNEPSPDTYCVAGASCVCNGANAGYVVYIYGIFQ